jgi:hypothetical protein
VLVGRTLLAPGDGLVFFLPSFLRRSWWTPYILSGYPIAAEPQLQTFYPLSLLCAQLDQWNVFVASAYVVAAAGSYAYIFTLTRSIRAAFIGGVIFGLSGFLLAHLGHTSIIHGAAWIPVVLWPLERLRQRRAPGWLIIAALAVANCIVGGHPQMWAYGLGLAAAYAAVVGWSAPSGRGWFYSCSTFVFVVGIGLAAVQLLPAVELIAETDRGETSYSTFSAYALPARELLRLLFPNLYGPIAWDAARVPFFGAVGIAETAAYVGWLPLGLTAVALSSPTHCVLVRFWTLVAILAVLLALGDAAPVARVIYHLPVYGSFRSPARGLVLMTLAAATLAGIGLAQLEHGTVRARAMARRAVTTLLACAIAGGSLVFFLRGTVQTAAAAAGFPGLSLRPWENPAVGLPLVFAVAAAGCVWLYAARPSRSRAGVLALLTVLDLASFGWFLEWRFRSPDPTALESPQELEPYRVALAATHSRLLPYEVIGPAHVAPLNRNMLWQMASAGGLTSVPLRRYTDLGWWQPEQWRWESRVLDLLAVRYISMGRDVRIRRGKPTGTSPPETSDLADNSRWRHVEDLGSLRVYENLRTMPRAWLVGRVRTLPAGQVLTAMRRGRLPGGEPFDPGALALVEDTGSFSESTIGSTDAVVVEQIEDSSMRLRTRSASAAFLVVSDAYYRGWQALVDGQPTPLYRTNYVLRGLAVPAGEHVVDMVFRPASMRVGFAISGASLAILIVGTALVRRML